MANAIVSVLITLSTLLLPILSGEIETNEKECNNLSSCSECLNTDICAWCVIKSKCSNRPCTNDNIIYPEKIAALMSGLSFCPRVVKPERESVFQSGKTIAINVKITQIYMYMAFTPWKCRFDVNGKITIVKAVLFGDSVYCEGLTVHNVSKSPYITGNAKVIWDYTKYFDGMITFRVCRCDLDPNCEACK